MKEHIIHLQEQPDFPTVDLSSDNAEILKVILKAGDSGLDTRARELYDVQRNIYHLACSALHLLGVKMGNEPRELYAFSHGFVSFDTINDLVHKPRVYQARPALAFASKYLVDTRSLFDIDMDQNIFGNIVTDGSTHDRANADVALAERHNILAENYPNTYDVLVTLGEYRRESMQQIHARIAGAGIAHGMQTSEDRAA